MIVVRRRKLPEVIGWTEAPCVAGKLALFLPQLTFRSMLLLITDG